MCTPLVSLENISLSFGGDPVFENASLCIGETTRMGVVGSNGAGKSSLLRIIAQTLEPSNGNVVKRKGLKVSVVSQFLPPELEKTEVGSLLECEFMDADEQLEMRAHLHKLGFTNADYAKKGSELSGGWGTKLMLALALAGKPDLLLLDEPTNNLDFQSLKQLETVLCSTQIPYLIVSHDRTFLDNCTTSTAIIFGKQLRHFEDSFSEASRLFHAELENLANKRNETLREAERIRKSAKQLAIWGRQYHNEKLSRRAISMERRAEKLTETLENLPSEKARVIALAKNSLESELILQCQDLRIFSPHNDLLFSCEKLVIRKGEKVFLCGENGTGKSVFLNLIRNANKTEDSFSAKELRLGEKVKVGYVSQTAKTTGQKTILSYCREQFWGSDDELRKRIISAGFPFHDFGKPLTALSGGETLRLELLRLSFSDSGLLLLDEPTNHLDIQGCEELERRITQSNQTALIVSHDRKFIERVADRVLVLSSGKLFEALDLEDAISLLVNEKNAKTSSPQTREERDPEIHGYAPFSDDEILAFLCETMAKLEAESRQKSKYRNATKLNLLHQKANLLEQEIQKRTAHA